VTDVNTASAPDAVKTGPDSSTDTKTPQTASDNAEQKGLLTRIDGLTAERERLKKQVEKMEADNASLIEKHKTEQEKQIDALVEERIKSEYGAKLQRADEYETYLTKKRDELVKRLPEDYHGSVDSNSALEAQITQAENVLAILADKKILPAIPTGDNPPIPDATAQVPIAEYEALAQRMARDPEGTKDEWAKMKAAIEARGLKK
jgi:hypothetical protein